MSKTAQLEELRLEILSCTLCKNAGLGEMVFGEGDVNAKIMFVGEAPGKQEAKSGRPFIGRSGKLLRTCIREIGLVENRVYITSPVKYLPKKGTPTKKEIEHSQLHFRKQLEIINPDILVLLGKTAAYATTNKEFSVLKDHGKVFNLLHRQVVPTIHPAAVLRFPKYAEILKGDFAKVKAMALA